MFPVGAERRMITISNYRMGRRFFVGPAGASFSCPRCHVPLFSPVAEIGHADECPSCEVSFRLSKSKAMPYLNNATIRAEKNKARLEDAILVCKDTMGVIPSLAGSGQKVFDAVGRLLISLSLGVWVLSLLNPAAFLGFLCVGSFVFGAAYVVFQIFGASDGRTEFYASVTTATLFLSLIGWIMWNGATSSMPQPTTTAISRNDPIASRSDQVQRSNNRVSLGSSSDRLTTLTGSDWHRASDSEKARICWEISQGYSHKYRFVTPAWVRGSLNTYFAGGNGAGEKIFDIVALLILLEKG